MSVQGCGQKSKEKFLRLKIINQYNTLILLTENLGFKFNENIV